MLRGNFIDFLNRGPGSRVQGSLQASVDLPSWADRADDIVDLENIPVHLLFLLRCRGLDAVYLQYQICVVSPTFFQRQSMGVGIQ